MNKCAYRRFIAAVITGVLIIVHLAGAAVPVRVYAGEAVSAAEESPAASAESAAPAESTPPAAPVETAPVENTAPVESTAPAAPAEITQTAAPAETGVSAVSAEFTEPGAPADISSGNAAGTESPDGQGGNQEAPVAGQGAVNTESISAGQGSVNAENIGSEQDAADAADIGSDQGAADAADISTEQGDDNAADSGAGQGALIADDSGEGIVAVSEGIGTVTVVAHAVSDDGSLDERWDLATVEDGGSYMVVTDSPKEFDGYRYSHADSEGTISVVSVAGEEPVLRDGVWTTVTVYTASIGEEVLQSPEYVVTYHYVKNEQREPEEKRKVRLAARFLGEAGENEEPVLLDETEEYSFDAEVFELNEENAASFDGYSFEKAVYTAAESGDSIEICRIERSEDELQKFFLVYDPEDTAYEIRQDSVITFLYTPEEEETEAAAEEPEPVFPEVDFEKSANGIRVNVHAPEGAFPEGTRMEVRPVYDQDALDAARSEVEEKENKNVSRVLAVDITFYNRDGEEIQPEREITVQLAHYQLAQENCGAFAVHVDSDNNADVVGSVPTENTEGSVEFDTASFSVYALAFTVEFTYDGFVYSITGESSVLLSEVFAALGIGADAGDAESVSFSDSSLIAVAREGQDWRLTSLAPFSTHETLTVTMVTGDKYVIAVTDTQESTALANFLTNVLITGAVQDADGNYKVDARKEYSIILDFAEGSDFQFDNDADLTYQMPQGIKILSPQIGDSTIAVVYNNRTYQVKYSYNLDTNGNLKINFDQKDPNYPVLVSSTNVEFLFTYNGMFDESVHELHFSDGIERDIVFNEPQPAQAYAQKSAVFDESTGTFRYTVKISATGDVTNVNVKDVISGDALIFNNDVQVSGNSDSYTDNGAPNGFDYTFASMKEGEEITITYSARLDFSKDTNKDGRISVDQTKNTVTVKPEGGDPHTAEYSREIAFKSTSKGDGTEAGTTADGNKIIDWSIEYNPLALASAAGDTITDTIAAASAEYMKYYGNGITVSVYDHNGNLVRTDNLSYGSLTAHSDSSWTYTIPSTDTEPYRYVITYQTVVDQKKVDKTGNVVALSNDANGSWGGYNATPNGQTNITKSVESYDTDEVHWISTISVPESGLDQAVVTDTLPHIWLNDANHYDSYKEGSLVVQGLLPGECYDLSVYTDSVVLTFYQDEGKTQPGLKGTPGGHTITIKLTTKVDQDWLKKGYETGGYEQDHTNTIGINGIVRTAKVVYGKPSIEKTGSCNGNSFKYTVVIAGVSGTPVSVTDTFDTTLLEVDKGKASEWDSMRIFGGSQYSQDAGKIPVSYSETSDGIILTANTLPLQSDGHYYPYYKIVYYLKLKDGVDLEQLAIANGGQYDLVNTAAWGDHESSFTYETKYNYLDKQLLNAGQLGGTTRDAQYQITFNPAKAVLHNGQPMEMKDVISANLSVDYSSVRIDTDPAGQTVPYSLSGGDAGTTVATYTIPDATKVVVTYTAQVRGDGTQTIVNKVSVNGEERTVTNEKSYGSASEGHGAVASFKIVKVDGEDANKKLEGVQFKVFAENSSLSFGKKDGEDIKELILTTDANGEIILDGRKYDFYFNEPYHIREMESADGYGKITFDYLVTLTNKMSLVDYGHYIYYFSDSMQIKNWPLKGIVVEKRVESPDQGDQEKFYDFRVTVLKEDGTTDEDYNATNGGVTFTGGVAEFKLKHGEQQIFGGFERGTRYKVEEIFNAGSENEFSTSVTYNTFDEDGKVTGTITEANTLSHTGELTQSNEIIVFTNTKEEEFGDLELSKVLVSDAAADASKEFTFTVTLSDKTINGKYGNMSFTNGVATVNLKGGEKATATGLPTGITYTITEASATGFILTSKTGDTGTISTTKSAASFTNTRTGDLELSKVLVSDAAADASKEFTFTVTLSDKTINGKYGNMSFTNGVATVNLKGGEKATATGLPTGITYTITEASATGFTLTSKTGDTGTISTTKSAATFTNTRETGDLELSKVLVSDAAADAGVEFTFTVELSDKTISKTYGDMTFTNGVATVKLIGGQKATATGLPTGITYTVTEADAPGFKLTSKTGDTGTISTTQSKAEFTNTRQTGDLELSKILVNGTAADADQEFTFTVKLSDKTISKKYGDMTFTNGVATVELKGGEKATATGLPTGIDYTVTEAEADGFTLTGVTGDSGTISTTKSTAVFTNRKDQGGLTVSKKLVSDAAADANVEFIFEVVLSDKSINGTYGDMDFTDGKATVKLKGGASASATGLPNGITYTVTEQQAAGFTLTAKTGDTGTISSTASTASFTNTRETGDLELSKTLVSDAAADANQVFTFTVKLSDETISKTYGDMTFTNGVATVELKGGEKATARGLPTGIDYTVTEANVTGFKQTGVTGDTGTISTTKSEAKFTNTRETGDLELSKVLVSDAAADKNQVFTFTVELSDKTISKKYGDMTFTNGVATVQLKGGEKAAATGLPTGIDYTVTEANVTGFKQTGVTGDTGKISTTKSEAKFTNTRETGDLELSKTLVSDAAADKNQVFTFTVELSDKTISKKYGDMTFTNGVATVQLKGGEKATATGLPTGITYTITEADAPGFTLAEKTGDEGTIITTKSTATFTNTRETGGLTVSKTVTSNTASDKTKEFNFTVTLNDKSINGTYGEMEFQNGVAIFTLKDGESKTAEGLPVGLQYKAEESEVDGFVITSTGSTGIVAKVSPEAAFTNIKTEGGLVVTKSVTSDVAADHTLKFSFTVTLDDKTVSGTYGEMTFKNGVAEFELSDGKSCTAEGLPKGIKYTVEEEANDTFTTTSTGTTGAISDTATSTAAFVNTRKTGDLELSKVLVSDAAADKNQVFTFTVELSDKTISKTYGDMTFTNGVATVYLKGGASASAPGLPNGITYSITELQAAGFTLTAKTGDTGTISSTASTAKFTNTRETGDLELSKVLVSDAAADKDQLFTFTVELSDKTISKTYDGMTFTNGVATVELKGGQTATAKGLPTGITYTIKETKAEGFTLTGVTGDTGTISTTKSEAKFTNTRETGDLELSKTLVSDAAADANQVFTFTVKLSDETISKTYGDMTFTNGVATVELKGGEKATATGLPTGIDYTVTEADAPGFTQTGVTGATGKISTTKSEAKFTNTRETGDLELSKTLVSDAAADANQVFTFTVKLSDETISKTYGDMTFTNGVATVELKGGEKATATGLPTGIDYTVTEADAPGFTLTSKTGDTGTIITTKSTATFTNTRETGGLKVSKTVVSSTAADKEKEFSFTVTLSDTSISGTYGEMEFKAGVATFTLKNGESITAEGLPTEVGYEVTETAENGFKTTVTGTVKGEITKDASPEIAFTNTRTEGALEVTKSVTSVLEADKKQKFSFKVTLDNKTVNGTYGDMTFTDGVAEFELADRESVKATGLPAGAQYTVEEQKDDKFSIVSVGETGTITENVTVSASFTNTRNTGVLEVTKTVENGKDSDKSREFSFTVTLSDKTINGKYGGMTFTDGVAKFTLKGGETAKAIGIPTGITYEVEEEPVIGYTTEAEYESGEIVQGTTSAEFTNTRYEATGTITFEGTKTLTDGKLTDGAFTFEIREGDTVIATAVNKADGTIEYPVIEYVLSPDQDDTGTHTYTVTETVGTDEHITYASNSYTVTVEVSEDANHTLIVTASDNAVKLDFVNTLHAENEIVLKAQKYFTGGTLSAGQFSFDLRDESGALLQTKPNEAGGAVQFDVIRFTAEDLKGAESKEFKYTITEQIPDGATDNGDGTWSVGAVTYDGHTEEVTVTVTNNYDGTLSVTAKYSSGDTAVFTNTENTVRIRKVRDSDGSLLAGAVLQIMDADGRAVYSWTSSAEERTFTLAAGTYRLHEVAAPAGYEIAADISFTVTNSGKATVVTMRDKNKVIPPTPPTPPDTPPTPPDTPPTPPAPPVTPPGGTTDVPGVSGPGVLGEVRTGDGSNIPLHAAAAAAALVSLAGIYFSGKKHNRQGTADV